MPPSVASWVFGLTAAIVVFPPLLLAGAVHLLRRGELKHVLRLQGLPPAAIRLTSWAVGVSETVIGVSGVAALVLDRSWTLPAIAAATLYAAYAIHTTRLVRKGAAVPCGCGAREHPVTAWVAVRAGLYALGCVVATVGVPIPPAPDVAPTLLAWVSGVVIGVLVWLLPRTLAVPDGYAIGG